MSPLGDESMKAQFSSGRANRLHNFTDSLISLWLEHHAFRENQ
jgi:hypothetical protein